MFGFKSTPKRKLKYAVKRNGRTISRHYTKKAAVKACSRGCRIYRIYKTKRDVLIYPMSKKTTTRKYKKRRRY